MEGRPKRLQWGFRDLLVRPMRERVSFGQRHRSPQHCQEFREKTHSIDAGLPLNGWAVLRAPVSSQLL